MFPNWMKFSRDAARLGYEVQTVMTLRMLKLARGGKAAETEARRMVAEKGVAFAEAASTLATGGSMKKVVRRVRSRVSQNKRRLSRYILPATALGNRAASDSRQRRVGIRRPLGFPKALTAGTCNLSIRSSVTGEAMR